MTVRIKNRLFNSSGVTLVEILMAMTVMTIAIVGLMGTFGLIQKSIQYSKARTLASNLAQEKMQILKQQAYYKILVSTWTDNATELGFPDLTLDLGYFPPEIILEGSINFYRLTHIQVAQEVSGEIVTMAPTTSDTGMKLITVSIVWQQGNENKILQIRSIASNPDITMSNAVINGVIRDGSTTNPIPNVLVNIAENVGWRDTTNTSGRYSINLLPGSYALTTSINGYFPATAFISVGANQTLTHDFDLTPMGSGVINGTVWSNEHLVVSQVVGSSMNASGFNQEWVEVFNPTTWTWTMASDMVTGIIGIAYQLRGQPLQVIFTDYSSLTLDPAHYYLFANTTPITAGGVIRNADAVFRDSNPDYPNIIKINTDPGNDAAGVGIGWFATMEGMDSVGWKTAGNDPDMREGIPIVQAVGLEDQEQYVRRTSTSGVDSGLGRAYDTNDNNTDFVVAKPLVYPPRNTSDAEPVVAGFPAVGAIVSASDGLSSPTTAYRTGYPSYAEFVLTSVATGTWLVVLSSKTSTLDISTVTVLANTTTWIPNDMTGPLWPSWGFPSAILSADSAEGFISGRVVNVLDAPINPPITVTAGGTEATAGATSGRYTIKLPTGTYTVTANPNNQDSNYVFQDRVGVNVETGEVTANIDFVLSQGGQLRTFITRDGANPLPGVGVVALDLNGSARDEDVSDSDGRVLLINLTTGTYIVTPILGSKETSIPESITSTVSAGATSFVGTFTVTGALGKIAGNVYAGGSPIKIGALIMATTATFAAPPALSAATLAGPAYYVASSKEDGTYELEVRGSTTTNYRVYAYYTTFSGQTPVIQSSATANIQVIAGQTTPGVNFSW